MELTGRGVIETTKNMQNILPSSGLNDLQRRAYEVLEEQTSLSVSSAGDAIDREEYFDKSDGRFLLNTFYADDDWNNSHRQDTAMSID